MGACVNIGIMGGTFDPVHIAHLAIAERAREQLALERVLFVPTWIPPHKPGNGGATDRAVHRLAMLRLALADHPAFAIEECELKRGGTSFTIDTLRDLVARLADGTRLHLIIGADNYRIFSSWRAADEILRLSTVGVYDRPGCPAGELGPGFARIEGPTFDLTSTWIRGQVARGASIRYLVPDPVRRYIAEHGLYQLNT